MITQKYNKYERHGDIAKVYFNNDDSFFLCDKIIWDKDDVNQICWSKTPSGYVIGRDIKRGKSIFFHRFIYNMNDVNKVVDHINGNILDNRLCNLREATRQQNAWNLSIGMKNKSGIIGVNQNNSGTWNAFMMRDDSPNCTRLGTYKTFEEAVYARMMAEEKYRGEYSTMNSRGRYTPISLDEILNNEQ